MTWTSLVHGCVLGWGSRGSEHLQGPGLCGFRGTSFASSGSKGAMGEGGMSACHSGLHLQFDLFVDCGANDIGEFGGQVPHIGRPSKGLRWSKGC